MTLTAKLSPTAREMQSLLNAVRMGRTKNTGTVTLTANSATTVLQNPNIKTGSFIALMPTTANAATEFGAGTLRFATADGTATITHVNNAQADRTFLYLFVG